MPVQSTDRKFVYNATKRYNQSDPASCAVWKRIIANVRCDENKAVLKALAEHLLEFAGSVHELVRYAPETSWLLSVQRMLASRRCLSGCLR